MTRKNGPAKENGQEEVDRAGIVELEPTTGLHWTWGITFSKFVT